MLHSLRRAFRGEVATSPFVRRCYAVAAGIYAQRPRAVAFPLDAEDVHAAVAFCRAAGLPLTARGAGSGMAGNNVGRGLVLDLSRHLFGITAYDAASGEVAALPGMTCAELNAFLRPRGRFLPPNPSSGAFCTLGGMVASNASGMRSVKYGPTAPWVVGIGGVWGTGETFDLRRGAAAQAGPLLKSLETLFRRGVPPPPTWLGGVLKNSAGLRVWPAWDGSRLEAVELLAASEGTLAVFTDLTFRTAPLPGGRALALAAFRTLDDLARAVEIARAHDPSGVEFLDRTFLAPLRAANATAAAAIPASAEAALFVELEGDSRVAAERAAERLLRELGRLVLPGAKRAGGEGEAAGLWAIRTGASPFLTRRFPGRAPFQFVEDCAVPPAALPALLRGLREVFAAEGLPAVLFGHAGEAHVHANPLFDTSASDLAARVERVARRVCDLIDELGGTLSGEHGDGLARAEFAARRFGEAAAFFAAVRRVCDPAGILNPGKVLPAPGWTTGRDLRHPWERHSRTARARGVRRASGRGARSRSVGRGRV